MEEIKSYNDLIVYKKAYGLSIMIYKLTNNFPDHERFGLTSQMRRCSISIPSNIAEGYRRGKKEYAQFLRIAFGSCAEIETQLSLSRDLGFIRDESVFGAAYNLQDEVSKLLGTIIYRITGGNK